jgi:hypothetical protein
MDSNRRQVSQSVSYEDFGLINLDGQYNCFVNVVIQALWNSEAFLPILDSVLRIKLNP